MFVMPVPEMPLASDRLVKTESLVTIHVLVASSVRAAVLIEPESEVLSFKVREAELMLSVTTLPERISPSAVNETIPPLLPEVPQRDVPAALMRVSESEVTVTPESIITPSVFVTKKTGPPPVESDPPVIVKVPVPVDASPDMLW